MPSPIFIMKRGEKMPTYSREELNAMSQRELNKAYRTVRRNLLRNVRGMERKGATFDRDMRPDIPKNITAGSVLKLQQMNDAQYRASHATVKDKLTGKEINWQDYEKERRKASARKGARTKKRMKEAQLNIKYIDIVDGYIENAVQNAGVYITDDPNGYERAQREVLEPYEHWKLLMGEALQDENTTKALNKALISMQSKIWDAVYVITHDSSTEIVCSHIWKLNNVIISLMSKYSAFSAEESQNMRGGGWYEEVVDLPY